MHFLAVPALRKTTDWRWLWGDPDCLIVFDVLEKAQPTELCHHPLVDAALRLTPAASAVSILNPQNPPGPSANLNRCECSVSLSHSLSLFFSRCFCFFLSFFCFYPSLPLSLSPSLALSLSRSLALSLSRSLALSLSRSLALGCVTFLFFAPGEVAEPSWVRGRRGGAQAPEKLCLNVRQTSQSCRHLWLRSLDSWRARIMGSKSVTEVRFFLNPPQEEPPPEPQAVLGPGMQAGQHCKSYGEAH